MAFPYFSRRGAQGELYLEDVALRTVAEAEGTPAYVYSRKAVTSAFDSFFAAFPPGKALVCVSVKANSNLTLLRLLAERGAGFDVVSGGELKRVIAAGGDPGKTVFAGVGKTDEEIAFALENGIRMFNAESEEELAVIDAIARGKGMRAPVSLRVNPDVDAKTHAHISTGLDEHKFGIPLARIGDISRSAAEFRGLEFVGIDCHIGSGITDVAVFHEAFTRMREIVAEVRPGFPDLRYLDLGGGLGVRYAEENPPAVAEYAEAAYSLLGDLGLTLIAEPGKAVFANSGVLLSKVLYRKRNSKDFVICDAGLNDLVRPVMYDAYHHIEPLRQDSAAPQIVADVVGPICETGDYLAKDRALPQVSRGDYLAVFSAGAYGFTMSSNYNTRVRPVEVLVDGSTYSVIRPREVVEALFESERRQLPPAGKFSA